MSFAYFDKMAWPLPDSALEQRLRYPGQDGAILNRRTAVHAASVVAAYRELITMPERRRRSIIRNLREAMKAQQP